MAVHGEARLDVGEGVVGDAQGDEELAARFFSVAALLGDVVPGEQTADSDGEQDGGGEALPEEAVAGGGLPAVEQILLECGRNGPALQGAAELAFECVDGLRLHGCTH